MRKLQILKTCLDFLYFFGIIALAGMSIFVIMALLGESDLPVKVRGQEIVIGDWMTKILLVFLVASGAVFLYAIMLLRRTLGFFKKREIFHPQVAVNFNRIGWCIVASALLTGVPMLIHNAVHREPTGFEISAGLGMDSFLMSIALGLLFMVISEAFNIGARLKDENELTI